MGHSLWVNISRPSLLGHPLMSLGNYSWAFPTGEVQFRIFRRIWVVALLRSFRNILLGCHVHAILCGRRFHCAFCSWKYSAGNFLCYFRVIVFGEFVFVILFWVILSGSLFLDHSCWAVPLLHFAFARMWQRSNCRHYGLMRAHLSEGGRED